MLGNLNNKVYLFPSDTKFSYQLDYDSEDDSDAIITSISPNNAILLNVDYANFTESSSIDSRFSFNNSLTIRLNQTKTSFHSDILQLLCDNPYYIGFENTDGQLFVLSPEYTASFNFTYTIENESSYLEVVFNTDSNMTAMWVASSKPTITKEYNSKGCSYKTYHVKKLEMGCTDDIAFEGNKVWMTHEGAIKTINFIKNTVTVIDSDTNGYEEIQLQFSIPYDNYKYYFHYNLLEFVKNTYSCIVYTDMGNCIFLENLFPSYKINTSESEGVLNTIQFTLTALKKDNANVGFDSIDEDDIDKEENDNVTYAYVGEYDMCINSYEKAHLLIAEINFKGNLNGNYYCLEGYEAMFQNYNIIGTYTLTDDDRFGFRILYPSSECSWMGGDGCKINGIPAKIVFLGKQTKTYQCNATCSFDILSVPNGFEVTPLRGIGDVEIVITNNDITSRTDYLEITFPDNSVTVITLIVYDEDDVIDRWVVDGTICSDEELDNTNCYKWERLLLSVNDPNTFICECGTMYYKERKYISEECDGVNYTPTNEYRKGDLYLENADACLDLCDPIYTEVSGEYICEAVGLCYSYKEIPYDPYDPSTFTCSGNNLYHVERMYYEEECGSGDLIATDQLIIGDVIQYNSVLCGAVLQKREEFQASIGATDYFQFMINNTQYRSYFADGDVKIKLTTYGFTTNDLVNLENVFNAAINVNGAKLKEVFAIFNTSKATSLYGAFAYQDEMIRCDLSYASVYACDNISYMFKGCSALTTIYMNYWAVKDDGKFTNASNVFDGCTSLNEIYMRGASEVLVNQIRNCLMESDLLEQVTIITD